VSRPAFYVYILASLSGTLYIGMTDDLPLRLEQHRNGAFDGFTKKYGIHRLMYYEVFGDSHAARAREKQIKKYSRAKKIALFAESNAKWKDLSVDLYGIRRAPSPREQLRG
jgi:putative endonuclease